MKRISNVKSWDRIVFVNDSSNISEVKYNIFERVMEVKFISGELYEYSQVEPYTFAYLIGADSVGKMFAKIKKALEDKGFRRVNCR